MLKTRTIIRPYKGMWDEDGTDGLFELCIDEGAGCNLTHSHDYGHDFPMERTELIELRGQIDAVLKESEKNEH